MSVDVDELLQASNVRVDGRVVAALAAADWTFESFAVAGSKSSGGPSRVNRIKFSPDGGIAVVVHLWAAHGILFIATGLKGDVDATLARAVRALEEIPFVRIWTSGNVRAVFAAVPVTALADPTLLQQLVLGVLQAANELFELDIGLAPMELEVAFSHAFVREDLPAAKRPSEP
jgi:hypothetical protein